MKEDTSEVLLDKQTSRRISPEGRKAMGIAGAQNLARHRASARTRTNDLQQEVDTFRAGLLRDAGANPSASKLGLIEGVVTTYTSIILVRYKLTHSSRCDLATLTERVSWLTSNLTRLLKLLNLDFRPRPRSLADLPRQKVEQNPEIEGSKAPFSNESEGKPL